MKLIKDHWYRPGFPGWLCGLNGCGRPEVEHLESVGEWYGQPPHLFIPDPRGPVFCVRCERRLSHSFHWGSHTHRTILWVTWQRKKRAIRKNWKRK